MKVNNVRRSMLWISLLGAALAVGVTLTLGSIGAQDQPPKEVPPQPTYASPEERLKTEIAVQRGDQERLRQDEFRAEFIAQGKRLEDLPLAEIEASYAGPATLEDATKLAGHGILVGTVEGQEIYEGYVVSTVRVVQWLTPTEGPETVSIRQTGGPALQGDRPVLVQLASDPVLLPGTEYVLFLGDCAPTAPRPDEQTYCTGGQFGRQLKLDPQGRVAPGRRGAPEWTEAVAGLPLAELTSRIAQAR